MEIFLSKSTLLKITLKANCFERFNLLKLNIYFKRAIFTLDFFVLKSRVNFALLKEILNLKRFKSLKTVCRQSYY